MIETSGPPPPPPCNKSTPCHHGRLPNPPGVRSFDVLCIDSGDYGTCSETAVGSSQAHWHFANISLDVRTREINISYHHSAAIQSGKIDAEFSTIAWAAPTGTSQPTLWSRQSGTDVADCCAHCVATKTCSAWTLDQLNHRCVLSSSAATAYPSSSTKGGYALRADPASLCQEKFQNSPASGAWQDNDMPFGVTCASLEPVGSLPQQYIYIYRDIYIDIVYAIYALHDTFYIQALHTNISYIILNRYSKNVSDFPRHW